MLQHPRLSCSATLMSETEDDIVVQRQFYGGYLEPGELDEKICRDCDFIGVTFTQLVNVVFDRCKFDGCTFQHSEVTGCSFFVCQFDVCNFHDTELDDTQFVECRMPQLEIVNASFFAGAFIRTSLIGASITGCDARFSIFEGADVTGAVFNDATFVTQNFRRWLG